MGSVQIKYFGTPSGRDKSIYQSAKGGSFLAHHGSGVMSRSSPMQASKCCTTDAKARKRCAWAQRNVWKSRGMGGEEYNLFFFVYEFQHFGLERCVSNQRCQWLRNM